MPIMMTLDVMLARRKVRSKDLAAMLGLTDQSVSLLKAGKVKGVRIETLDRLCQVLECQPGDLMSFSPALVEEVSDDLP